MTREELHRATAAVATLERDDALWAASEIIDLLINELGGDPDSFPCLSPDEWALRLDKLHRQIELLLIDMVCGAADLNEVISVIAVKQKKGIPR
jgi:hypothetical protein